MKPDNLWFMDAQVKVVLPKATNVGGVTLLEHNMHGGFATPFHVHHGEDETFYILEGRFRFQTGTDAPRELGPGETVHIPSGTPHGFRVLSAEGGRCLTVTCGGFEQMVRESSRPAAVDGLPERVAEPTPAMVAELAAISSRNGIDLIGPPIA